MNIGDETAHRPAPHILSCTLAAISGATGHARLVGGRGPAAPARLPRPTQGEHRSAPPIAPRQGARRGRTRGQQRLGGAREQQARARGPARGARAASAAPARHARRARQAAVQAQAAVVVRVHAGAQRLRPPIRSACAPRGLACVPEMQAHMQADTACAHRGAAAAPFPWPDRRL